MKIIYCTTFLILFLLTTTLTTYSQKLMPNAVKIESVGFDTETITDVSCDVFDSTFTGIKKSKEIDNLNDLLKFTLLLKQFRPQSKRSFDVRGKIVYYYKNRAERYCFDVFGCFYKDGKLYYNKKLLIYISDQLYGKHPQYLDTLRQQ